MRHAASDDWHSGLILRHARAVHRGVRGHRERDDDIDLVRLLLLANTPAAAGLHRMKGLPVSGSIKCRSTKAAGSARQRARAFGVSALDIVVLRGLFGIGRPLPFFDVGAQEIAKRQTADVLLAPLQAKPRRNADHGADGLSVLG